MENEHGILLILCTFPNVKSAEEIGGEMVKRSLAACVNLLPKVSSIYFWEGKTVSEDEILAVFKISRECLDDFEKAVSELHPYDVPEIVAIKPDKVSEAYSCWVRKCCEAK